MQCQAAKRALFLFGQAWPACVDCFACQDSHRDINHLKLLKDDSDAGERALIAALREALVPVASDGELAPGQQEVSVVASPAAAAEPPDDTLVSAKTWAASVLAQEAVQGPFTLCFNRRLIT